MRKLVLAAVAGAVGLALAFTLLLLLNGGGGGVRAAEGDPIGHIGIDMCPSGTASAAGVCPTGGAANVLPSTTDAGSLGVKDRCISKLSTDSNFTIDIYADSIPVDEEATAYNIQVAWSPPGLVPASPINIVNPITQGMLLWGYYDPAGGNLNLNPGSGLSPSTLNDARPDLASPWSGGSSLPTAGEQSWNGPQVIERVSIDIVAPAGAQIVKLWINGAPLPVNIVVDDELVLTNPVGATIDGPMDEDGDGKVNDGCPAVGAVETLCANNVDDDGDGDVNDGCPAVGAAETQCGQYSVLLAIDTPCPPTADLKVTGQAVVGAPADINISEDVPITLNKTVHNNGPSTPVAAHVTSTWTVPAGCTVVPNPLVTPVGNLEESVDTPVVENFTIHCTTPSTKNFSVENCIAMDDPNGLDPVPGNNCMTSQFSINVHATTDLKIVSQTLAIPVSDPKWGEGGLEADAMNCFDTVDNDGDTTIDLLDKDCKLSWGFPRMTLSNNYTLTVDKVMHNNGGYTPVVTNIAKGAFFSPSAAGGEGAYAPAWCADALDNDGDTVINDGCPSSPPATGTGQLPGDCQVTPGGAGGQVTLVNSTDLTHTETFTIHCGSNNVTGEDGAGAGSCTDDIDNGADGVADIDGAPGMPADGDCMMKMGFDNDADTFVDEDAHDGIDNDLDGKIDEDSAFQIAVFGVQNTISPKDTHITDTDPTNNVKVTTIAALAVRPFTPTYSAVIDSAYPADPNIPPVSDICLTGAQPCKVQVNFAIPAGNPMPGIVSYTPNPFSVTNGIGVPNGLVAGQVGFTVFSDANLFPNCSVQVGPAQLDAPGLYDGAIALAYGEGPDSAAQIDLANPFVYPTRLNSDPVVAKLIAGGAFMWARYVGYITGLGMPVNLVVFNMGGGNFATVTVTGDPSVLNPKDTCSPYNASSVLLGEYSSWDGVNYNPTGIKRLTCGAVGDYTFSASFTRADIGIKKVLLDGPGSTPPGTPHNYCNPFEVDSSVTLSKDEWIGNGVGGPADNDADTLMDEDTTVNWVDEDGDTQDGEDPVGDILPVSMPTGYEVTMAVSADSTSTVNWLLSATSHTPCTADWVAQGSDTTYPPIDLNGTHIARLGGSQAFGGPGTINVVRKYIIHCTAPGTWENSDALQIIANVSNGGATPPPDPNMLNNQAQNHVSITADDDVDGDGVPNPSDNCPFVYNPDQTDTDGDGIGNACDIDDDDDTIIDNVDACPLIPEDLDGIDDTDGCPDTDVVVSVDKDHEVDVDVSTTKSFPVTVTATNGNVAANVEYQLLLVSDVTNAANKCEARWIPLPGDSYAEDTIVEGANTYLHSQITRMNDDLVGPLAPFESRSMTRSYNLHCNEKSDHSVHLDIGVVPQPPVEEENVQNNVHKQDIQIEAYALADLKKVSLTVLAPPTNIAVSANTDITLREVIHNNGPVNVAAAQSDLVAQPAPAGCTVGPPTSFLDVVAAPVSVDVTIDHVFTIHCTQPSTHKFDFSNSVAVLDTHVHDPNPNNNSKSASLTVNAIASADVKIVSQAVVTPPTDIDVSANVPITLRKVLHNNGPYGPVTATLTSAAAAPADCTVSAAPVAFQVDLPTSVDVVVDEDYTLHCTQPSEHTFTFDNTLSAPKEAHIGDPDLLNNVAHTDLTVNAISYADVKIVAWSLSDDLPLVPGNQVLIIPGILEPIVSSEVLHNNGPYEPVDAAVTKTVADVVDCVNVEPNAPAASVVTLPVSVDVPDEEVFSADWTDLKKPPYSCDLVFDKDVTVTSPHVVDPDPSNNSASAVVTLVRDTDGDGVPDNYAGIRDNCQDVPNDDQEDEDGDGLGDVCDSIPAHDVQVISMVAYGPAPINLSDNVGRYMWVIGKIYNPITKDVSHDELVKIGLTLTIPTAMQSCTITTPTSSGLIIPGLETFILRDEEAKWVLYRIRFECHDPVLPGVSDVGVELCITHLAQPSDDDGDTVADEDPIDGIDNDGDSLIDEDPPEGTELPPYLTNNCISTIRTTIVHQP